VTKKRRTTERGGFHALAGQQYSGGFDFAEAAFLDGRQRGQGFTRFTASTLVRTCIPTLQPSTPSTTAEGAFWVEAPVLRLSA
jgi:hypothetical protein